MKKRKRKERWSPADYTRACISCGTKPTIRETEMCAACTFGEAEAQVEFVEDGGHWIT